jgi:hypothetical protein
MLDALTTLNFEKINFRHFILKKTIFFLSGTKKILNLNLPISSKHQLNPFFLHNGWTKAIGSGQEKRERPY